MKEGRSGERRRKKEHKKVEGRAGEREMKEEEEEEKIKKRGKEQCGRREVCGERRRN